MQQQKTMDVIAQEKWEAKGGEGGWKEFGIGNGWKEERNEGMNDFDWTSQFNEAQQQWGEWDEGDPQT